MDAAPKAVFLSYASEDAAATQGIVDALRARGIEVWFDQSELRGGDAWDQKIRKQIRECALFVPVISANTNARGEGYFRLEWKLAVDRSHLMADDEPFLFPVVIDEFPESAARVPDRFREVQWVRLGTKETPASIAARVARLLEDPQAEATSDRKQAPAPKRKRVRSGLVWAIVGVTVALTFATRPLWHTKRDAKPSAATEAPATQVSEAAQLAQRAIELTHKLNFSRDDLGIAAGLARKATELEPTLALAWGARAWVESRWLGRNWDLGAPRRQAAEEFARRAVALDPDEPHALRSQAQVFQTQRALPEAQALLERVIRLSPNDNEARRAVSHVYVMQGRTLESLAILEDAIRRDPRDVLSYYLLGVLHAGITNLKDNDPVHVDAALGYLDRALEIQVFAGALVHKAALQAGYKGDVAAAQATLDRLASLPVYERTEDRATFYQMWIALLDHQPQRALDAAARTTSTYFSDSLVAGPVAWMKGLAHRQAGRNSAAVEEWRTAEALLRTRLKESPDALPTQAELAITLALLGRKDEATKQFARYDAAMRDQGRAGSLSHVRFHAAMGDGKRFAAALREARNTPSIWLTDAVLARDPWFDAVRGQPEFAAAAREPRAGK